MKLDEAGGAFRDFCGPNLTQTLSQVEAAVTGATSHTLEPALQSCGARLEALIGAGQLKRIAGQINVVLSSNSIDQVPAALQISSSMRGASARSSRVE
jgi:hypothetical protein